MSVKKYPTLEKALKLVGKKYITEAKRMLTAEGRFATGELDKSFQQVNLKDRVEILVAKHGVAIDEGAAPAQSNMGGVSEKFIVNIMEWARMKGITPNSGSMRKMANAIARTIKRDGKMPAKIFDRAYAKLEKEIGIELTESYLTDIKKQFKDL